MAVEKKRETARSAAKTPAKKSCVDDSVRAPSKNPTKTTGKPLDKKERKTPTKATHPVGKEPSGNALDFLKRFGGLMMASWGIENSDRDRRSRDIWEERAMADLLTAGRKRFVSATETLDWMFTVFPDWGRTRIEQDFSSGPRMGAAQPPSKGSSATQRQAGAPAQSLGWRLARAQWEERRFRNAEPSPGEELYEKFWAWLGSSPEARSKQTMAREGGPSRSLLTRAIQSGRFRLAMILLQKAPPLEWDPQWLPEALAAGLETPSKHDEKLPIQAREIAQWTNTPAHKKALIESLLAREKSIFGSEARIRKARAEKADDFLLRHCQEEMALSSQKKPKIIQWTMSVWAANSWLKAQPVIDWMKTTEFESESSSDAYAPAMEVLAEGVGIVLIVNQKREVPDWAARAFWEWLVAGPEWDGTARSRAPRDLDALQWACLGRNPDLLALFAKRSPSIDVDGGWIAWEELQKKTRSNPFNVSGSEGGAHVSPLPDDLLRMAERSALMEAAAAGRAAASAVAATNKAGMAKSRGRAGAGESAEKIAPAKRGARRL